MAQRRTIRSQDWSVSSAGPFAAALAAASNLSVGSGVVVVVVFFFSLAHLTASARFRAGPQGSVSGRLCGTASWRDWPSRPGFPLRLRRRHSLLGHPMPAEELGSPHGRLTGRAITSGPRRGYRFPHVRAAAGVGASYTPRTAVLLPAQGRARSAPAALPRRVLRPRSTVPSTQGYELRGISRRFESFTRPACPSPVAPGWIGRPWASPRASHPAVTGGARRGRGQVVEHGPGTTRSHQTDPPIR